TWANAIGSLQLPLYALLYSRSSGVKLDSIMPAYIHLGLNEIAELPMAESVDNLAEKYAALGRVILSLLNEITDASKPFLPAADPEKSCPRCPFNYICGTQNL
ncbi:MAG TPA: PD-(D/E)XK nuclease family protein, partial [Bacteroidota bacterium]|nr:PD-(D/E)XK nuclease family protein [Bacteroidota bacterium]